MGRAGGKPGAFLRHMNDRSGRLENRGLSNCGDKCIFRAEYAELSAML